MDENKPLTTIAPLDVFASEQSFELAQRMVKPLAASNLVPTAFRGDVANCLLALNMAQRMKRDPFAVMQAIHIVHGKPGFSSSFLIGLVNSSGILRGKLKFRMVGTPGEDSFGCYCAGIDADDGEELVGPTVTIATAKSEGWYDRKSKTGEAASKWPSMPELMLRYRAAAFWVRVYAPELTNGVAPVDEIEDVGADQGAPSRLDVVRDQVSREKDITPEEPPEKVQEDAPGDQEVETWPRLVDGSNEDGVDIWVDSSGEEFNPERHAWPEGHNAPSVTKAGTFRKKRGAPKKTPFVAAGVNENPPHRSELPPPEEETPPEETAEDATGGQEEAEEASFHASPTVKALFTNIDHAEDAAALERLLNHPVMGSLDERSVEEVRKRARARSEKLKTTGESE